MKELSKSNGYKTINDVLWGDDMAARQFMIPSFQRGYRWTEKNVRQLIEDIYENVTEKIKNIPIGPIEKKGDLKVLGPTNETEKYCIQPLVVTQGNDGRYCVIDGQQRLITCVIILSALNNLSGEHVSDNIDTEIDIEFDSRENTKELLKTLYTYQDTYQKTGKKNEAIEAIHSGDKINFTDMEDIDHAYMLQAYSVAYKYFSGLLGGPQSDKLLRLKYDRFSEDKKEDIRKEIYGIYRDILLYCTQFIWYESIDSLNDPQKVFTNFNTGKIELTDSELIKAVVMTKKKDGEKINKDKQIVVAEKWSEIENYLHEASLWAFIPHASGKKQYDNDDEITRIDVLYEYLIYSLGKNSDEYRIYDKKEDKSLYYAVSEWIARQKDQDIYDIWKKISYIFSGLYELYHNDSIIYNMTALYIFLCYESNDDSEIIYNGLINVLKRSRGDDRKNALKDLIYQKLMGAAKNSGNVKKELAKKITGLRYAKTNDEIINFLVTYNIAMLCTAPENGSRYDFIAHKKQTWHREHIFARNMDMLKNDTWTDEHDIYARNAFESLADTDYIDYVFYLFYTAGDKSLLDNLTSYEYDSKGRLVKVRYEYDQKRKSISFVWNEEKLEISETEMNQLVDHARNVTKNYGGSGFFDSLCRAVIICDNAKKYLKNFERTDIIKYYLDSIEREPDILKKQKLLECCEYVTGRDVSSKTTDDRIKALDEEKEKLLRDIRSYIVRPENDETSDSTEEKNSPFVNNLTDNSMGNMALLTDKINIIASNRSLYKKREEIMQKIKDGGFVPTGTQLVFNGAFTGEKSIDPFWLPGSRMRYLKDIIEKISNFLN